MRVRGYRFLSLLTRLQFFLLYIPRLFSNWRHRQVFWLNSLFDGLPIQTAMNSGEGCQKESFSVHPESASVTAAGPLPIYTGFPILSDGAPVDDISMRFLEKHTSIVNTILT
jgi:hypothetical protein